MWSLPPSQRSTVSNSDALPSQMSHPLAVDETQVELSEEAETTLCLRDSIIRVFFIRVGGVGPVNGHVLTGESQQTEDQGKCGKAWPLGRQV